MTDPRALADALALSPALVWIETPSNPLLRITDLRFVIEAAHRAGALVVVDNTFLSPALQQPIAFGADFVLHSTTKYINGHSDVVGGAVIARDAGQHEQLVWWANALGLTGSPFDSFLTLRGLRTLDARLRVHQENTHALVALLDAHPAVRTVHYPGLDSHPHAALARKQMRDAGTVVSFDLKNGSEAARRFSESLELFALTASLGSTESLVMPPQLVGSRDFTPEQARQSGVGPGTVRLSIGLEDVDDLIADIDRALGLC